MQYDFWEIRRVIWKIFFLQILKDHTVFLKCASDVSHFTLYQIFQFCLHNAYVSHRPRRCVCDMDIYLRSSANTLMPATV